jgi:hypothetical protein
LAVRELFATFRSAYVIVAVALALGALGLLLSKFNPSEVSLSETKQKATVKADTQRLDRIHFRAAFDEVFAATLKAEAAAAPPRTTVPDWASGNIPAEWEPVLIAAFTEGDPPLEESNRRLMTIAMHRAAGAPRVQQECLAHLLHGLPDDDLESFRSLALNPSIPLELRRSFVQQVLSSRAPELSRALIAALSNNSEALVPANADVDLADLWSESEAPRGH